MNTISGTIVSAQPSGSYETQYGEVFTTILTIKTDTGDYTGEIGSKAPMGNEVMGRQIEVEWRETPHGVKFKKYNPKYANQSQQPAPPPQQHHAPPQAQQAPSQGRQQSNVPEPAPEGDMSKLAIDIRCKVVCAIIQNGVPAEANYESMSKLAQFILDGKVDAGEPDIVKEVTSRPLPPDDEIPWENS